jgi:hypothetical protein
MVGDGIKKKGRESGGKEGSTPAGFLQHPQFELFRNKPVL